MLASQNSSSSLPARLPDKVHIGPIEYKVTLAHEVKSEGGEDLFGKVSFRYTEITIVEKLALPMRWQCLFHEITHVFFEQIGMENAPEGQVDALAYKLLEFLIDNGGIKFPAQETSDPGKTIRAGKER